MTTPVIKVCSVKAPQPLFVESGSGSIVAGQPPVEESLIAFLKRLRS